MNNPSSKMSAKHLLVALGIVMSLTACSQTLTGSCSHLRVAEYSQPFKIKLRDELRSLPKDSAAGQYVLDQTDLRRQVWACQGLDPDKNDRRQ